MASKGPIRFGAIGCGNAGTSRIRQLAQHSLGLKVVSAVDVNPARLDNLENVLGYGFERFEGAEDYKRLIDDTGVDAVGIFTPHIPHLEHVEYAIKAGKHVIIEKPMVCGAANALRITKMLDERGLTGIVHYQRHYELKFMKARELIQKGVIGDITTFFVYMAQDWYGKEWRGEPAFSGGGQINDSGSHYQDILLWMTGLLPKSAEGHVDSYYHGEKKKVEINGSFNVELSNGAGGRIIILGDIPGGFVDDVRICGTDGDIMFFGNQVLHRPKGGEIREVPMTRPKGYPDSPCDNFVKLLHKRNRINRVPFIFGARVALLTDAMLKSAHAGGKRVECADLLKTEGYDMSALQE